MLPVPSMQGRWVAATSRRPPAPETVAGHSPCTWWSLYRERVPNGSAMPRDSQMKPESSTAVTAGGATSRSIGRADKAMGSKAQCAKHMTEATVDVQSILMG